ncbi:Proton pump-interactor [Parasponia andersonii]|uniref:Proton pump-interactor n=1 Tax=Parasponia andersonii TaxID=3476 RepID=A0A2P5BLK1_PARAD|nr:Proton pump-interactor [Parasponia andersonii]
MYYHQVMEMRQVPQTLDSAGDGIRFGENACANANQGSEELDHEPSKTSDHDDGANVPKKVHTFYFVKFWPHQEPSSEPDEIQEIEKLIRKMDRDQLFIRKRLEKVIVGNDIDTLKKKQSEVRAEYGCIDKKLQTTVKKACCYPNRLLLSRGLALARKKDIAALERFSHTEGEKFMSQWNKSKAFRDDYKERVLHHHSTAVNN